LAAQQRAAQQRIRQLQHAQQDQRRLAAQQRAQLARGAGPHRRTAQRMRVWLRTAAKRAARQVETELAIQQRNDRQRRNEIRTAAANRSAELDSLLATALFRPLDVGFESLKRPAVPAGWLASRVPFGRAARERARAEALAHNEAVDRLAAGYRERTREAVEEYAAIVLAARSWPAGFDPSWRLRYRRGARQLDAEYDLPGPQVVPAGPADDRRRRYADVVAQVVLCVLVDLYRALEPEVVDVIRFNGRVRAGAAGALAAYRPHLVSLAVTRERWASVRLTTADPLACLRSVDALVSPDPYALVPVRPGAVFEARP
jgi:hypothetical protein